VRSPPLLRPTTDKRAWRVTKHGARRFERSSIYQVTRLKLNRAVEAPKDLPSKPGTCKLIINAIATMAVTRVPLIEAADISGKEQSVLSSLSLENFKSFERLHGLRMKPITVICGPNSCGKSSILQSILLLKQTFESKTTSNTILMNGRHVRLGNFQNMIHDHNMQRKVRFDLEFVLRPQEVNRARTDRSIPVYYLLRDLLPMTTAQERRPTEYFVNLTISLSPARRSPRAIIARPPTINVFSAGVSFSVDGADRIAGANISMSQTSGDTYSIEWRRVMARVPASRNRMGVEATDGSGTAALRFVNLLPQIISFQPTPPSEASPHSIEPPSSPPLPHILPSTLYRMNQVIQTLFESYSYIGPLREEPSRRYIYEDEVAEIGSKGENAAYILLDEQTRAVSDSYYYDYSSERFVLMNDAKLGDVVQRWFEAMDIRGLGAVSVRDIIQVEMLAGNFNKTRVSIADVGFGVSQIFPIIVEGIRVDRGGTLILEQPEIHLHPRLQMCLADYFVSLALSGKHVILETHSDHIINRLVRRAVESRDIDLSQLIQVFFAQQGQEGTTVEEIRIDPESGVINWPKGFFDQSTDEQEKTIRAGIARRRDRRLGEP
jgi:predicted ATPase